MRGTGDLHARHGRTEAPIHTRDIPSFSALQKCPTHPHTHPHNAAHVASPASARPAASLQARALPARAPARPPTAAQPESALAWARLQTAGAALALSAALVLGGAPGALADLNKYEAAAGGEFGNGTALQYGEARPAAQVQSTGPGNVFAYHVAAGTGRASLQSLYRHSNASASVLRHALPGSRLTASGRAGQHRRQGLPRPGALHWPLSHHCRVWQACSPLARHARGTLSCESLTAPSACAGPAPVQLHGGRLPALQLQEHQPAGQLLHQVGGAERQL